MSLKEINLLIDKVVEIPNVSRSLVEAFLGKLPLMEMVDYERMLNILRGL